MRLFVLSILLLLAGVGLAQDPVISLNIVTKDDDTGKKLAGATVVIKKNGAVIETKTAASNGKVPPIDLPINENYVVYIKKEGYVTKVANINGHYDYPEDLPPFIPFPIQTSLFKVVDGVDFQWLETTPMIKFELDQYGNQTWDQNYTKQMLKKIEDLKKEMAEKANEDAKKKADFDAYVASGDKAMAKPEYQTAIDNYTKALELFDDAAVKAKLEDAKKKLKEQNDAAETEKAFQEKMALAKEAYTAKDYQTALGLYKEASGIKPNEQLPKDRIKEIEKILKEQADKKAQFDKLVADGDQNMTAEDYDNAITNYSGALKLIDDAGVKAKLEDARKKKEEKEAADEAAKELEEQYNNLITQADKSFDAKSYEDARSKYEEALKLKPNESHPSARISQIDEILKKLKEDADAAKKLEEDYNQAITDADLAFKASKWDQAIAKYEEALGLKPDEKYPKDQIKLANENKDKEAAEAELEEKYKALMAEGKTLKDGEKYEEAITKYKEAKALKPGEQEPQNRIDEIQKILNDLAGAKELEEKYNKLMADGNDLQTKDELEPALGKFEEALGLKPGDSEAQKKIDEIKKLIKERDDAAESEAKFNKLVAEGDQEFKVKSYETAKQKYQEALGIKDDQDVKDKIAKCDEMIKANADAQELQAKYDAAIKQADDAFNGSNWEEAISKYEEALGLKPDEKYPNERIEKAKQKMTDDAAEKELIEKFNALVAEGDQLAGQMEYDQAIGKYKEAIALKPDQTVSQKILDLEEKKKEEEANKALIEKYKAKLAEADEAFKQRNWDSAKELYADALDIKGDEDYPKKQLDEIDRLMKEESEQEVEAQYQKIITKADGLRDDEKFEDAISYYERAKNIKKSDPYPQEQIDKINALIEQRKQDQADKDALEKKYKDLIASADQAFGTKNYQDALGKYKEALGIKPDESYPKEKISEIEGLLAQQDQDAALEAKYKAAIEKADKLFADGNYIEAKPAYQDALDIKNEQYPKDQIALCDQKMQEQSNNEEEAQYQKLLNAAQKKFDEKDYEKSLDYYNRAVGIRPNDPFPKAQIDMINKLLADMDAQKELDAKYKAAIEKADQLFAAENFMEAKTAYQDALDIKSSEQYPKDQIALCDQKMQDKSANEEEEQYQKILKVAQKKFDEKNYQKALELYQRAKGIRPSDPIPQQRIDEINQLLKDMEDEKAKRDRFDKLIMQADTHFERKEFDMALETYLKALDIFVEQYPQDQVAKCREFLKNTGGNAETQYQKLIKKADEYFDATNYTKAKGLYERATKLKPSDQYPKDRIAEINNILNPPKTVGSEVVLKDYGPPVNETPIDMEILLNEAREQANEFELTRIYQQRDDAQDAIFYWEQIQEDETYRTKDASDKMVVDISEAERSGEIGRQNVRDEVEIWQLDLETRTHEYERIQNNDIQFQKKKVEAMTDDIVDNNYDNDIPRQEYLLDVEEMRLEAHDEIVGYEQKQYDINIGTRNYAENMEIEIQNNNRDNDIPRQNTLIEVEDMQIANINKSNEDAWDQEDEVMYTKEQSNLMVETIISNNLDNDIPRQDVLPIVEDMAVSYQDREHSNANDQYDENISIKNYTEEGEIERQQNNIDNDKPRIDMETVVEEKNLSYADREHSNASDQYDVNVDTRNYSEDMQIKIQENNLDNDDPRQQMELVVEEKQLEYQNRETSNQSDQYDKTIDTKNYTENMEISIQEANLEREGDREGYEEVIEEKQDNIFDYNQELKDQNQNNSLDTKDYTDQMFDDQQDKNKDMMDKSIENADNANDAIDNHILHTSDNAKENQESLENNEDYIEDLKDIEVEQGHVDGENELGKKYPEGVTEESFAINDSNGLLKAYVIRRIVVVNGHGKVYEKTQTRYGAITYTRNGEPISEYQWDDETSSANTARN